jgi:hypothetical protein
MWVVAGENTCENIHLLFSGIKPCLSCIQTAYWKLEAQLSAGSMFSVAGTTDACVTVHLARNRRMNAWSITHRNYLRFRVPGSLNDDLPSDERSATLRQTLEMHTEHT